jgi:hypothetical protein
MKTKRISSKKKQALDPLTVGIDIGDQRSQYCMLSDEGEVVEEGRIRTTANALAKHFEGVRALRIAIENGTHSIWINEQLRKYGHEVIVANVRELHAICRHDRKSGRVDAEKLARFARLDPNVLRSITQQECCAPGIAHADSSTGCAGSITDIVGEWCSWARKAVWVSIT